MVDGHKSASVISVVPFDEKGFAVVTIFVGVGEKSSCSPSVSKKEINTVTTVATKLYKIILQNVL